MKREYRILRDQKIVEMRREGHSMKTIADQLQTTTGVVSSVCRKNGLGGKAENHKQKERFCRECGAVFYCAEWNSRREFCSKACQAKAARRRQGTNDLNLTAESEIYAAEQVARHEGWEYVDGYTGSDGWVNIRHLECGAVVRKSMVSVRQGNSLKCPECARRKTERREQALAEEREAKAKERHEKKLASFTGDTRPFKVCVVCGGLFFGGSGSQICCSPECSKKHLNAYMNRRKDKRIKREQIIDRDIDIHKLFTRDKGVCHICGGLCDWNDYKDTGKGIIVGGTYPSIDHVVPISKGGLHSWSNVKLAHVICNTRKRDKTA